MLAAGDEFMRTQGGNNNPYNQDNETSWIDWTLLERNRDVFHFFQHMIAFRKAHPSLCRSRFWRDDVRWYGRGAQADQSHPSRQLAWFLNGASQNDDDLYVMMNAAPEDLTFRIQEGIVGEWRRVADTSLASPDDFADPGHEAPVTSLEYLVKGRSVVILVRATLYRR
jgi:glycogen operon protein